MKRAMLAALRIVACALYLGGDGRARAGVIYQTGFENPPFTVGPLAGQDGWSVFSGGGTPNAVTVQAAVVFSGSQAVEVNTAQASGQTGPFRIDQSPASDTIVTMQAEVLLTSSSIQTAWQFAGITPSSQFMGGFNPLPDGQLQLITAGFPVTTASVITRGTWNQWEVVYNFTTQTFDVLINSTLVAANEPFFAPSSTFGEGLFDTFNNSQGGPVGHDIGYLDNYSITGAAVPEPGSIVLLGSSSLLLLGLTKVKSKRHCETTGGSGFAGRAFRAGFRQEDPN
jgi:hypothetical protein